VRLTSAHIMVAIVMLVGASPCVAQTLVTSLEELRRTLAAGDWITIVPTAGQPVTGQLIRLGDADLDLQVARTHTRPEQRPRSVTMPLTAIQSLERSPDSVRNGAAIGAAIGAGFGGAMFTYAFVIDRNEMAEWAPFYLGAAAAYTGIGALIGWMIDAANSKPHIRFQASGGGRTKVSLHLVYARRRGTAVAVSFSR
jgi:hypothetical protein